jgi:hypothetical protein
MKKYLLFTVCAFGFVISFSFSSKGGNVLLDAHTAGGGLSTWNITTTHPNELIIISCGGYGGGASILPSTAGTVKVNGNNATYETRAAWRDPSFTWQANIWAYAAPAAGLYTIVCTETNVISPYYFNFATSVYEVGCTLTLGNILIGGHDSNHGPTTCIASITTVQPNTWVYGSVNNNDNGGTGLVGFSGQLTLLNKTYINNGIDGAQADSTYPVPATYNITTTDIGASNVWMTFVLIGVQPNCVLPVELLNFTCNNDYNKGSSIELNWSTATEKNSSKYTIERSIDGNEFTPIGNVDAAGNSETQRNYSFVDPNPLAGENYYRLTETDIDGSTQTFNITSCSLNNPVNMVYPNPNNGTFTLSLGASTSTQYLVVTDLMGREITKQQYEPSPENTIHTVNLPAGCKGVFMAKIINGDQTVSVKKVVVY